MDEESFHRDHARPSLSFDDQPGIQLCPGKQNHGIGEIFEQAAGASPQRGMMIGTNLTHAVSYARSLRGHMRLRAFAHFDMCREPVTFIDAARAGLQIEGEHPLRITAEPKRPAEMEGIACELMDKLRLAV